MNRPIRRVGYFCAGLILLLVAQLTYLQVVDARKLANDPRNARHTVDQFNRARGKIVSADGQILTSASPAFADVKRGNLRLLLAGPQSSAGRPMPDGCTPGPGGWNRIHFVVDDIDSEVARLRDAGAIFRNHIVTGPGGKQILLEDPSGNVVELFQPAAR